MTRTTQRGRTVTRKPTEGYARLAVPPALLKSLIAASTHGDRPLSIRRLSELCGHKRHQHLMRLVNGQVNTTSEHTADIVEQFLGHPRRLFTRHSARTPVLVQPVPNQSVPAPRRAA